MPITSNRYYPDHHSIAATPIVEVDGVVAEVERVNPTGSIKDRIA